MPLHLLPCVLLHVEPPPFTNIQSMKTSVIKSLPVDSQELLTGYPSVTKHTSEKKLIEFITGCKFVIVCGGYIFVVGFEIYDKAETMFENWIDSELKKNPKDYLLKLTALKQSLINN